MSDNIIDIDGSVLEGVCRFNILIVLQISTILDFELFHYTIIFIFAGWTDIENCFNYECTYAKTC